MRLKNENRLFPFDPAAMGLAQKLFAGVCYLPVISPYEGIKPRWFAEEKSFDKVARWFIIPGHHFFRMLFSQGATTETAGFFDTAGFKDDACAFCSIPTCHDVSWHVNCVYPANLVAIGRLGLDEAHEAVRDLACRLARQAYRL